MYTQKGLISLAIGTLIMAHVVPLPGVILGGLLYWILNTNMAPLLAFLMFPAYAAFSFYLVKNNVEAQSAISEMYADPHMYEKYKLFIAFPLGFITGVLAANVYPGTLGEFPALLGLGFLPYALIHAIAATLASLIAPDVRDYA